MKKFTSEFAPVPDWMSEEAQHTLGKGYLLPGETPRDMWWRVAHAAHQRLLKMGWDEGFCLQEELFYVMYKGWLGLASPVASNMGTNRGKPVSCYSVEVGDSISSIYSHKKEVARMSQEGGGVGISLSNLRHRGAPISRGGTSTGVVPWAIEYDVTARTVNQGGVRRGSFSFYLDIDHPDLEELLLAKDHSSGDPRGFIDSNIAVVVRDEWMESMLAGDEAKFTLFAKVLETRLKSGSPYILYIDNVNAQRPDCYKERGLEVKLSNLCFAAGTMVKVGDNTELPIEWLAKDKNTFFTDSASFHPLEGWSIEKRAAIAFYTGESDNTVRLHFEDGTFVHCTANHKVAMPNGYYLQAEHMEGKFIATGGKEGLLVTRVEPVEGTFPMYDLQVEANHNFFLANGALVHNCSEITLYTDENHSFVCVLSSLNLAKYDEWKDWVSPSGRTVPELGIWLLEAVVEEFITKARGEVGMGRAVRFAEKSRALGLGTMGLHLLYQQRGLPFASTCARELNIECHKFIAEETFRASRELAALFGEPEWCEGHGIRHTHRTAIAPTKTNSVISGAFSQGIEPINANVFTAVQAKGDYLRKNPVLEALLERKGYNTTTVWSEIIRNKGSVQSLPFLSLEEKEIFLTAREIDQMELIRQAAERQPYVCQSQSVNLFVYNDVDAETLLQMHITAWHWGLNSLYYLKSESSLVSNKNSTGFIITKPNCPYCTKLKEEVPFEYVEIDVKEAKARGYWDPEWKTVPQLWVDGVHVGGYDDWRNTQTQSPNDRDYGECQACEA